jgi:hypothetical protein
VVLPLAEAELEDEVVDDGVDEVLGTTQVV